MLSVNIHIVAVPTGGIKIYWQAVRFFYASKFMICKIWSFLTYQPVVANQHCSSSHSVSSHSYVKNVSTSLWNVSISKQSFSEINLTSNYPDLRTHGSLGLLLIGQQRTNPWVSINYKNNGLVRHWASLITIPNGKKSFYRSSVKMRINGSGTYNRCMAIACGDTSCFYCSTAFVEKNAHNNLKHHNKNPTMIYRIQQI